MSDYVYESGMSTKRRRQRRTAITMLLTLLLLFSAFWWAWSYMRADDSVANPGPTTTPTSSCEGIADPRKVTVNVYNATTTTGLAGRVAGELKDRGFTVGTVANDPMRATIDAPGALRYGDEGRPYATIFKTIIDDPVLLPDTRTDDSVDLVIGDTFTKLNDPPAGVANCTP